MKRAAALKDFFGINHLTNKDIAGSIVRSKLPTEKISSKFNLLILARDSPENKELVHDKNFGKIRYDGDNIPKGHGQYEPRNTNALFSTIDIKQRYTPSENQAKEDKLSDEGQRPKASDQVYGATIKIVDVGPEQELSKVLALFKDESTSFQGLSHGDDQLLTAPRPSIDFLDRPQVSPDGPTSELSSKRGQSKVLKSAKLLSKAAAEKPAVVEKPKLLVSEKPNPAAAEAPEPAYDVDEPYSHSLSRMSDDIDIVEDAPDSGTPQNQESFFHIEEEMADKLQRKASSGSKNALEYLKSIRAGKTVPKVDKLRSRLEDEGAYPLKPRVLLDSQGFRNYSRQVPDWDRCRHVDILNYLKKSIVYHNYDVLAVNKPYGLASHCDSKREKLDMNNLVQELANKMNIEKVYLAHRLDKTTTGVLLFATSQERASQLHKLFRSDQIRKTYWCILKGTPDPDEAIIDIPIGEYTVAGKVRSCLAPEKIEKERQMSKRYREARRAITEYCVLQSHKQVSLVEVKPRTGVKHQIRCHFGFGLNRPILGDHKYSHLGKIAPQELAVPVLNLLHLRQAKVRTLPIHLHAKTIVVPNVKPNGQNLFIEAPLPAHFKENMKALGLLSKEVIEKL